jgi:chemotaxis methyl-accepting protein methylase/Tfp pilus assembly protein PilF
VKSPLAEITELLRRETGIALPAAREAALHAALRRAAPGTDPDAFRRAISDPASGRGLLDRLIDEVTVQETIFARDRGQLDMIDWHSLLLAARAAGSPAIRVWSAGCATGEEAYTLALLADEAFAPATAPVDVLGTDISVAALAAAAAGQYRERAVRALAATSRGRYLDRQPDGSYLVGERLRRLVRFRRHNLASDPFPPRGEAAFDLVACRNVLIYFGHPLVGRVIESLDGSLRPGGLLMLGAADALMRTTGRLADPVTGPAVPARRAGHPLRRPLGRKPAQSREQWLAAALDAADKGDRDGAIAQVASALAGNPLDADAHFVLGLVTLEAGEPAKAVAALRRALYADPAFWLAAFTLGRAHDALGDAPAARRAYERVLRTIDPADHRHELILQQVDIGDIAAACRLRLGGRP